MKRIMNSPFFSLILRDLKVRYVGSFIPAASANISPVDRIFTRIGAGDDIISGQSTFMVEMSEVAQILKFATERSLIVLDEVGRGTSTFDGMSIASPRSD